MSDEAPDEYTSEEVLAKDLKVGDQIWHDGRWHTITKVEYS